MRDSEELDRLSEAARASGLLESGSDGVVMLSGGADSAALAVVAVRLCGPQSVSAVHVNYGLRPDAGEGEEAARALCAMLRIDLHIERPQLGEGNLQARAREARYEAAERLRAKLRADWIAVGHTRTDLTETILYRLAVSPGARALAAMRPRSGRVIRPLLAVEREQTRRAAREAGLPVAEDPSNADRSFARNRIRAEVVPALAEIGPELERNVAETHAELLEDAELIGSIAATAIREAGCEGGAPIRHEELVTMAPALLRAVLTELAERSSPGRPIRIDRRRAARILRLAAEPEGGTIELAGGVRAVAEAGTVRFTRGPDAVAAEPVRLLIPGETRYGEWELRAELREGPVEPAGPELATLDAESLGAEVEVRAWREGDRMQPLGMGGGSRSLQDLFTDRGIPRSLRRRLPVLVAGERIAWVAGVAVSEEFRLGPGSRSSVVIHASAASERLDPAPGRDRRAVAGN